VGGWVRSGRKSPNRPRAKDPYTPIRRGGGKEALRGEGNPKRSRVWGLGGFCDMCKQRAKGEKYAAIHHPLKKNNGAFVEKKKVWEKKDGYASDGPGHPFASRSEKPRRNRRGPVSRGEVH